MAKGKNPYFKFFSKDWFDFRVQRMSLEAQGLYINMLSVMHKDSDDQCSIELCDKLLRSFFKLSPRTWKRLMRELVDNHDPIFLKEGREGRVYLVSKRLREENLQYNEYCKMQSDKGKLSATKRQQLSNRGPTVVQPQSNLSNASTYSNSITTPQPPKGGGGWEVQKTTKYGEDWNALFGDPDHPVPGCDVPLSKHNSRHLIARLKEKKFVDGWDQILKNIANSDQLKHGINTWGGADFGWVVKNDENFRKILSGNYRNKTTKSTYNPAAAAAEANIAKRKRDREAAGG